MMSDTFCIHHGTYHCTMRHDGSDEFSGDKGATMSEQPKPVFSLGDVFTFGDEKKERAATPRGMALVCFCHGEGRVLLWQANQSLRDYYMAEVINSSAETFSLDDFDPIIKTDGIPADHFNQYNELESGIFIAHLSLVDDGPESWEMPHIRDIVLGVKLLHPVSKEEWKHYLREEWPWDFEDDA